VHLRRRTRKVNAGRPCFLRCRLRMGAEGGLSGRKPGVRDIAVEKGRLRQWASPAVATAIERAGGLANFIGIEASTLNA